MNSKSYNIFVDREY